MIYVIDTETTGLDPVKDELLQISVIDDAGNVLYDSYIKPDRATSWEAAMAVNGITPAMVSDAPAISQCLNELNEIFRKAETVIGYNTDFDLSFLKASGVVVPSQVQIKDAMSMYSKRYGEWDEYNQRFKWIKLTEAAGAYGYDWNSGPSQAHNSLADCYATLFVYNKLIAEDKQLDEDPSVRVFSDYETFYLIDSLGKDIRYLPDSVYSFDCPVEMMKAPDKYIEWLADNALDIRPKQREYMHEHAAEIGASYKAAQIAIDSEYGSAMLEQLKADYYIGGGYGEDEANNKLLHDIDRLETAVEGGNAAMSETEEFVYNTVFDNWNELAPYEQAIFVEEMFKSLKRAYEKPLRVKIAGYGFDLYHAGELKEDITAFKMKRVVDYQMKSCSDPYETASFLQDIVSDMYRCEIIQNSNACEALKEYIDLKASGNSEHLSEPLYKYKMDLFNFPVSLTDIGIQKYGFSGEDLNEIAKGIVHGIYYYLQGDNAEQDKFFNDFSSYIDVKLPGYSLEDNNRH